MGTAAIAEIARVAHPIASRERWLAVFIAYFDESGHHTAGVLNVAGIVARERKWRRFERDWSRALRTHGIKGVFRMSQYENRQGEFADLTAHQRASLIRDLAAVFNTTVEFGVNYGLVMQAFQDVIASYAGPEASNPYEWIFQTCLEDIAAYARPKNERVACVFEDNELTRGRLTQRYSEFIQAQNFDDVFGTLTFSPKGAGSLLPLQAADMLAYEGYKQVTNQVVTPSERPMRKLLVSLMRGERLSCGYFDRTELTRARARILEMAKKFKAAASRGDAS